MDDLQTQKLELRRELKSRRAGRSYDPDAAERFCVHLAELCLERGVTTVASYLAMQSEPDTELFIDWAIENEITVLAPVSHADGSLSWVEFDGATSEGIFGFAEPVGQAAELSRADLILIPALGVDGQGHRIGKGKGYYDRALSALKKPVPVVALVFKDELLDSVPVEAHDQPIDAVVTEDGITRFTDRLN